MQVAYRIPEPKGKVDFTRMIQEHKYNRVHRVVVYGFNSVDELDELKFPFSILSTSPNLVILGEFKSKDDAKSIPTSLKCRRYCVA
jgi:hypothetical protein